jgi:hypothetical protein
MSDGARQPPNSNTPKIETQRLTRVTMNGLKRFIGGGHSKTGSEDDTLQSVESTYVLEDMDYHNIRKSEARGIPSPGHE